MKIRSKTCKKSNLKFLFQSGLDLENDEAIFSTLVILKDLKLDRSYELFCKQKAEWNEKSLFLWNTVNLKCVLEQKLIALANLSEFVFGILSN